MAQYVGDVVAKNIVTALGRLSDPTEELETQMLNVCQRINDPQPQRWFGTDKVTLALAIIRVASKELGDKISCSTLGDTLDSEEFPIYSATRTVEKKVNKQ